MIRSVILAATSLSSFAINAQTSAPLLPLQGTWEGTVGGNRYVEQWTCSDSSCDGSASSYRGDTVHQSETMRITEFAGHWHLLVWMGNGPAVAFTCISADAATWIFENREHDFPQRISYTVSGDALDAYIAGPGEKAEMRFDFNLKRVN